MRPHSRSLLFTAVVVFLGAAAAIAVTGLHDDIASSDMAVVLGSKVLPDGTASPRLRARLDTALRLWKAHEARFIFVSGGVGKEGFDEGRVMQRYLIEAGVPEEWIITDSAGNNTYLTAR